MSKTVRFIVEAAIASLAGFAAFVVPVILNPPKVLPKAPLFPMVREAVEHLHPGSFIALAVVGLLAGILGTSSWIILGLTTVAALPLCTIAELAVDSTSHNLLPFEFVMYAGFSIPAIFAAGIGRAARIFLLPHRQEPTPPGGT